MDLKDKDELSTVKSEEIEVSAELKIPSLNPSYYKDQVSTCNVSY